MLSRLRIRFRILSSLFRGRCLASRCFCYELPCDDDYPDFCSVYYQRIAWEALKKSIHGLINKVNVANIQEVVLQLFKENLVRGRGLFSRSCIDAQSQSPTFTHVYGALVAVVNTKVWVKSSTFP